MSTLRTDAILDSLGGNTTTVNGVLLNAGTIEPDDRIINGDFGVWQRGVFSLSTFVYGADRWVNAVIGGSVVQSRQAFDIGDTIGVNSPTYFLRQIASGQTLATHYAATVQRIESVRSYAGQTITVLGWARRSSGAGNMSIDADQVFGTGGTPSGNVLGINQNTVALTASWVPFAAVMSIPSISGKTLGTNSDDYLGINFWISAGSSYNTRTNSLGFQTIGVDLWGIHIKRGIHTVDAVNLYRPRDPGTELLLCQRYCSTAVVGSQSTTANVAMTVPWSTKVTMRVSPTINVTLPAFGAINASVTQDIVSSPDGGYFTIVATAGGGYVVGRKYLLDAEI